MNFCTSALTFMERWHHFKSFIFHSTFRLYGFYVERHHDSHLNKYLIFQIYLKSG